MITEGVEVVIEYVLSVEGEVVDTTEGRGPVTYVHGRGELLVGLEEELEGMAEGDCAEVVVPPETGYGHHDPRRVQQVPYEAFGDPDGVRVGRLISGEGPTGRFHATIAEVKPEGVILDLNHPLAGKTLHFEVQILAIRRNLC